MSKSPNSALRRDITGWLERVGQRVPVPVLLFAGLWVLTFTADRLLGGHQFQTPGPGGATVTQTIKPMFHAEHARWIFVNALLQNWLAFDNGVPGVILVVPLAGLLYAELRQNPLIGVAAAFAGVSAGFSANLVPATPIDVIVGMNAKIFTEVQGLPFTGRDGQPSQSGVARLRADHGRDRPVGGGGRPRSGCCSARSSCRCSTR